MQGPLSYFPSRKREILLAKIHDQATQIKELMAQLEAIQTADRNMTQMTASLQTELARSSTLGSPGSGTFPDSLGYGLDATSTLDTHSSISRADSHVSQENLDWIAKARENFEAFGESIRLGSSSTIKQDLVHQDLEDSTSSDGDYHVAMESSESEAEIDPGHLSPERLGSMRERRYSGKASPGGAKMAGLPAQASPFGMMAALSMGQTKSKRPASVISDVSDLGVANEDFFRARMCNKCERRLPLTDLTLAMDLGPLRLSSPGHRIPPLLRKNIITSVEAEKLFKMYSLSSLSR
jgi:hypothetical protein